LAVSQNYASTLRRLLVDTDTDNEKWPLDESTVDDWDIKTVPAIDLTSFDSMMSSTTLNSYAYTTTASNYGNITIGAVGSSSPYYTFNTSAGSNGTWGTTTSTKSGLHVTSDAEFEGDIKWKGRSLGTLLEKIEDRLAILPDPDPEKLKKFAALKKAYDQYKLMEKLIGDDWKDKK
jgi:hypothetical protein